MTSIQRKTFLLVIVFLAAGLLYQGVTLAKDALPGLRQILQTADQPALWRSAYFSQGRKFANYVEFLNQRIPDSARVVLPPSEAGLKALGNTPFMQFFLAPRQVINCTDPQCVETLSPENTVILVVNDFPGADFTRRGGRLVMFNTEWGIYLPDPAGASNPLPLQNGWEAGEVFRSLVVPVLWLALVLAMGTLFVHSLLPGLGRMIKITLGYGLGLSITTLVLSLAGWLGFPLTSGSIVALSVLLLGSSLAAAWLTGRGSRLSINSVETDSLARRGMDFWPLLLLALGALSLVISVGKGYHTTDEILLWGAKGYGIAATGDLQAANEWGTRTVIYPLHIPILIASFRLLSGDLLPASKIVFSGYYICLSLLLYHFLLQFKVRRSLAGIATLLVATAPLVFRHGTIAYANLAFSYYLVTAVLLLVAELSRPRPTSRGAFLSGLFFAAACWTRPEGLVMSAGVIALLLGLALFKRWGVGLRQVVALLSPLAIYQVYWLILKPAVYSQAAAKANLPLEALRQLTSGNLHIGSVLYILRSLALTVVDRGAWGVLGVLMLLALFLSFRAFARHRQAGLAALSGLVCVGAVLAIYQVTSYDTVHDLSWWISTGFDRLLLPGFLLLWVGGLAGFSASWD